MKHVFDTARWIWYTDRPVPDSYGEFCQSLTWHGEQTTVHLSVDGDYTLFVNGVYAASNQYADFEHYKIYDSIDLTPYLAEGDNTLTFLVWHIGMPTFWYKPSAAGLLYAVVCDGKTVCVSGEDTLCREEPHYISGRQKTVTMQLGPGFCYDATRADDTPFAHSVTVSKVAEMYPRPVEKSVVHGEAAVTVLKDEGNHYLVDLGAETVGLPVLRFSSPCVQTLTVSWGEHIEDGGVRRRIGDRDFSFEYVAQAGENTFANYMLRLGCRYIEVTCEESIEVAYIGVYPQTYPVVRTPREFDDPQDKAIYDLCVTTLERCMLEHYVDTPWREQGLYVYDSRNQMLCGYRAFENGNRAYARANLWLIAQDRRADGLLSITYPCGSTQVIPSFSLHYFAAVREYLDHTGDLAFGADVYDKLLSVLAAFKPRVQNGLFISFEGADYWNFYDWTEGLDVPPSGIVDLMGNLLCIRALQNMKHIAALLGRPFGEEEWLNEMCTAVKAHFFRTDYGFFAFTAEDTHFTALGNALGVLTGLTTAEESRVITAALVKGDLSPCTLSMKGFIYDALLAVDESYRSAVREDIHRTFLPMLAQGATTVWEVADGAAAFDNAGSLCHGWSAMPILYL